LKIYDQATVGKVKLTNGELKLIGNQNFEEKKTSIVKIFLSLEFLHSVAYMLTFYGLSTPLQRPWHPHGHKLQQVPKVPERGC
jgi:hypothetical protein